MMGGRGREIMIKGEVRFGVGRGVIIGFNYVF